jgi:tetratricopeptide (TPR) repeat protein
MKLRWRWIAGFSFLLFTLIPAQSQSYDEELRLGIRAYQNNQYDDAMQHFRRATELDPSQVLGHMYLATALVSQYIPGVEDPDNLRLAEQAIEEYQHVVDSGAETTAKLNSSKGIAYLYLNMKKWDEAKAYYQKASGLDPNDPEPYYSIGVIDWTRCYQPRMEGRAKLDMRPDEHLNPTNAAQKKLCDELRAKNTATIGEGIDSLNKAIELRPNYDDAMAYMNLMYREKADLECDNPSLRAEDLQTADSWVDKAMAAKRQKAEKAGATQPTPADSH